MFAGLGHNVLFIFLLVYVSLLFLGLSQDQSVSASKFEYFQLANKRETCQRMVATFHKTYEDLQVDVQSVKEWLKTQHHLPETPSDQRIENFILLNKFRVDRVREKIDMYYTIRSSIPDFYDSTNPKLPHMKLAAEVMYLIPYPKMFLNHRLVYMKLVDPDVDHFDYVHVIANAYNVLEVRLAEDYLLGDIYIIDFEGLKLGHLRKISPMGLFKSVKIFERVFSNRVKNIHYVNVTSFVNSFVTMVKKIIKPKLAERIQTHLDTSILSELFPKDVVPKDYGGDGRSLAELSELLKLKLVEYQDRFDELDELRVDESLRVEKLENDDVLGYHGTFKQLDFD